MHALCSSAAFTHLDQALQDVGVLHDPVAHVVQQRRLQLVQRLQPPGAEGPVMGGASQRQVMGGASQGQVMGGSAVQSSPAQSRDGVVLRVATQALP
jgi:hypothetical protein